MIGTVFIVYVRLCPVRCDMDRSSRSVTVLVTFVPFRIFDSVSSRIFQYG